MNSPQNPFPDDKKNFSISGYQEFEKKLRIIRVDGDIITLENGSRWQVSDLMARPVEFEIRETVIVSRGSPPNPKICKMINIDQGREVTAIFVECKM